jgi:phosphatidylglycerol---prolipoprotein diacylglyceryl transferase
MMTIDWNPVAHLGPIPINWYGLTWALGFLIGGALVRRHSARYGIKPDRVDTAVLWIAVGTMFGARLYYVVQNDFGEYLQQPFRILAFWEGGLAFFGGLFGGILAAWMYARRAEIPFGRLADLFAPAVPIGSAIGRISCFLDGMDYGTPTQLPWGVVYTNLNSYAPNDGVPRHPDQVYELVGDLVIAAVLFKLRDQFRDGSLFLLYLILFSVLRFFLFFVRGNVPVVAFGLKNGQLTALAILVVAIPMFVRLRMFQRENTRLGGA